VPSFDFQKDNRYIGNLAVECRIEGLGWDEIVEIVEKKGVDLGPKPLKRLKGYCKWALMRSARVIDNASQLRELEARRLDHINKVFVTALNDPERSYHDKYKAGLMITKVSERRCTMLGLNVPVAGEQNKDEVEGIRALINHGGSIKSSGASTTEKADLSEEDGSAPADQEAG
jgi:hypothetical protein